MGTVQTIVRKIAVLLVFAAAAGAGVVLGAPSPAAACSCTGLTDEQALTWADAAFIGTVTDRVGPDTQHSYSSLDAVTWTFAVEGVYKGNVGSTQEVVSALSSGSCGLSLDPSQRYLVFATVEGHAPIEPEPEPGQLAANFCGGTRPAERGEAPPGFPQARTVGVAGDDRADRDRNGSEAASSWPWVATFSVLAGVAAIACGAVFTARRAGRSI
jgi:hypothetical protein